MSELTLNIEHVINAPIEFVFNAWLDPQIMAKFMTPAPHMTVSDITANAVEGGGFKMNMVNNQSSMPHYGEYIKIDRYSQLVFSWLSKVAADDTRVTLDLSEVDGGTLIKLSQIKFLNEELRDRHIQGWNGILGCLEQALKN
ncbi:MAG: SRPBCC domain-containing protein [Hyphomicrobiales bacterium]